MWFHPTADLGFPSKNGNATSGGGLADVSRVKPAEGAKSRPVHRLYVDHSEGQSALLVAVRASGTFDVRMGRLAAGDYLIDDEVLIERKTVGDCSLTLSVIASRRLSVRGAFIVFLRRGE
jgi:ERCC4-type nuclease